MSFLTTTRLSTMSLGPLLDAPDSCVGWLKPEVVDGETAPCARELLLFPHGVLLLPLVVALLLLAFRTLDPQSFLVKEGVTYCLCCLLSYYCRSTTSSTPYYFLNPGLVVGKNHSLGGFSFWGRTAIFSWWEVSSICAGALFPSITYDPSSPWKLPHVFAPPRTPRALEFPCGLTLEPVISKTGYSLPVDRFRLSLPGRFNLGCIVAVVSVWEGLF